MRRRRWSSASRVTYDEPVRLYESSNNLVYKKGQSNICPVTGAHIAKYDMLSTLISDMKIAPAMSYWSSFHGASSLQQACDKIYNGDLTVVNEARKLMENIDAHRNTERAVWQPSICGAYPIVPEAIAGFPECMRVRASEKDAMAAIRIFVGTTVSGGISVETLRKRGLACLALALRLAESRPVELWAYNDGRPSYCSYPTLLMLKIDLQLDLAQAASILADPAYTRGLAFEAYHAMAGGQSGSEHWGFGSNSMSEEYNTKLKAALGATDQDLVLRGGFLYEVSDIASDPVKWVNKVLAEVNGEQEE